MSRPKRAGLGYFPLDTGFFEDKRIRRLMSRFGADGPLFYIYVLCKAYDNGYYVEYNEDFNEDAALDLGCSTEKIGLMLHYLLNKSLLDSTLFSAVKVLSSHGIQSQYQAIKKALKRDVEVDGDSWILNEFETEGFIKVRYSQNKSGRNPDKSGRNPDKSGIYCLKESKGKEKESKGKEKESKGKEKESVCAAASSPRFTPPTLDEVTTYVKERGSKVDPQGFIDFYASKGWLVGKTPMKDWKAACRNAEHWERWEKKKTICGTPVDVQPSEERVKKNSEWLDHFLEENNGVTFREIE